MRYLFGKACKKLRINMRKYILFMVQIAIGACMIALSLNMKFTFQQKFEAFQEKVDNQYVNISAGPGYNSGSDVLSIQDYRSIKENFPFDETRFSYYMQYDMVSRDQAEYLPIIFVDDNFYPMVMKTQDYRLGSVYIGKSAKESLDHIKEFEGERTQPFINREENTLFGEPISDILPLEDLEYQSKALLSDGFIADVFEGRTFEDYVIFPLSVMEKLDKKPAGFNHIAITLSEEERESLRSPVQKITQYIQQEYEGEFYLVADYYQLAEQNLNKNAMIASMLDFLSAFVLLIVVFGFMGLLFVLINRRNKEFAISLMNGATRTQLIQEIYMEILSVVMIGVMAGSLFSIPLLSIVDSSNTGASFHLLTLVILIAGGIVVSAVVCALSLHRLKYISPISILKNE